MKLFVSYQPLNVYLPIPIYFTAREIACLTAAAKAALILRRLRRGLKPHPFKTDSQPLIVRRRSFRKPGEAM